MSLRRQFVLVFVAFAVLVAFLGGMLAYRTAAGTLEGELDKRLVQVAAAAAEPGLDTDLILAFRSGVDDESNPNYVAVQNRLQRLQSYVDEAYILRVDTASLVQPLTAIVTTQAIPIGATVPELMGSLESIRAAVRNQRGSTSRMFTDETDGREKKYGFVPLGESEAVLAVLMPAGYTAPMDDFRRDIVVGAVLAAVAAALLAWFLATTVTGSLNRLGRVALRIQRGHMDEPVRREGGGDLGRLSRAMERMRVGILNRDEQLRLMLAQVAHEIRNPLGGLELLASEAAVTEEAEERGELIGKVRTEINALNRIIDDFLTYARPLRPQGELHDMREPITEAVGFVEMEMRGSDGKLTLNLPAEVVMAQAEPEHVKRVALNLVRNAAQAGKRVEVSCTSYRGEAVLIVADDGPGVPEEMKDRIFEPFVTDKEQGAGLGLAIVKRVVEANRGRIELSTDGGVDGEGAEFRVYFRGGDDLIPEEARS